MNEMLAQDMNLLDNLYKIKGWLKSYYSIYHTAGIIPTTPPADTRHSRSTIPDGLTG
jgi:hypothetical protein